MKLLVTGILFFIVCFSLFSVESACMNNADTVKASEEKIVKPYSFNSSVDLSVQTGLARYASINELYSYRKYTGNNIFYNLNVMLNYEMFKHNFSAYYSYINRISVDKKMNSELYLVNFTYDLMYKTFEKNNFKLFFMLNSSTTANITRYTNVTELVISSIAPGVYLQYYLPDAMFNFRLAVPVLSLAYRDNYAISRTTSLEEFHLSDTEAPKFESFNNLFIVEFSISGKYKINENYAVGLQYSFKYLDYKYPRKLEYVNPFYSVELSRSF
jgi:hypothetical protein